MKKSFLHFLITIMIFSFIVTGRAQDQVDPEKIWSKVRIYPNYVPQSVETKEHINSTHSNYIQFDEADVLVGPNFRPLPGTNTTQSELSIDVHPLNSSFVFASSNASNWPFSTFFGTGVYWSLNAGVNWVGFDSPPFGSNSGDPVSVIGPNGYMYEGYITNASGQGVAVSTNRVLTGQHI